MNCRHLLSTNSIVFLASLYIGVASCASVDSTYVENDDFADSVSPSFQIPVEAMPGEQIGFKITDRESTIVTLEAKNAEDAQFLTLSSRTGTNLGDSGLSLFFPQFEEGEKVQTHDLSLKNESDQSIELLLEIEVQETDPPPRRVMLYGDTSRSSRFLCVKEQLRECVEDETGSEYTYDNCYRDREQALNPCRIDKNDDFDSNDTKLDVFCALENINSIWPLQCYDKIDKPLI